MTVRNNILIGSAVIVILVAGYSLYRYGSFFSGRSQTAMTQSSMQTGNATVDAILAKLSKHMPLPTNDSVTIYTIQDPKSLAVQQPFFEGASAGDLLIIFPKTGEAIIYSPSKDAIVHIGPITNESTTTPAIINSSSTKPD